MVPLLDVATGATARLLRRASPLISNRVGDGNAVAYPALFWGSQ